MRKLLLVAIIAFPSLALAEWHITNKDNASYELKKTCGSTTEDWSIAGGVTSTVKDGESCTIKSSKISK